MNKHSSKPAVLLAAAAAMAASVLPGCRGQREDKPPRQFFPDMDDAPKYKPQSETQFFPDHRTMRPTVPGTVAFGRWEPAPGVEAEAPGEEWQQIFATERARLLQEDDRVYRGVESVGPDGRPQYVSRIPVEVTESLLAQGQERFNIYCAVCHGMLGRGEGMVGQRWTGRTVANLHDPKYSDPNEPDQKGRDGYLFHVAMNGVVDPAGLQKMPAYNHALSEADAWAVVAYIRVLQEQQRGNINNVPEPRRAQLMQELSKLPPPQPEGQPTSTGSQSQPDTASTPAPAQPAPQGNKP